MDLWYNETWRGSSRFSMKVEDVLLHTKSEYQTVAVVKTEAYGRVLLLDGLVMLTERDEFVYHEMIAHPALLAHPNPKRVLIIGGGDGGTLREVCRHESVEAAHLVEIDGAVIDAAREFFPAVACGMDAPAASVFVEDGLAFIDRVKEPYDIIIVDSTDPVGPAVELFEAAFFSKVKGALAPGGIFVQQTETPYGAPDIVEKVYGTLRELFPVTQAYMAVIPTYPSGFWTFCFCSETTTPDGAFSLERARALEADGTRYYRAELQQAAFVLPVYARDLVEGRSPKSTDA